MKADELKGRQAIVTKDFQCEIENGWLIKKGTKVYINGNESDGTVYCEYIEYGFSIDILLLQLI